MAKTKFTFKIVRGSYHGAEGSFSARGDKKIIHTDEDLGKKHNKPGSIRFVKVNAKTVDDEDITPDEDDEDVLENDDDSGDGLLTEAQLVELDLEGLKAYVEKHEIKLSKKVIKSKDTATWVGAILLATEE